MKSQTFKYLLGLIIIFVFYLHLAGCASFGPTKPNLPYAGNPHPPVLIELAQKNTLLAQELGKLPELQDGISQEETSALEGIVDLYSKAPAAFGNAFKQMYQVGIPDVRKYCSPLQALFWLCEDKKYDSMEEVIKHYDLENLLRTSWQTRMSINDSFHISDEEAIAIARNHIVETDIGPMHQTRKKPYLSTVEEYLKTKDTKSKTALMENIKNKIQLDYKINKNRFTRKGRAIIKKYIDDKIPPRWKDFNMVANRINSPELIHHYIDNNFKYRRVDFPPAYTTFTRKYGNCTALADFGKFMLKRAGYETFVRTVYTTGTGTAYEHSVSGIKLSDDKYLLVVDFGHWGNNKPSGPFDVESLDLQMSHGNQIISRQWGHNHW